MECSLNCLPPPPLPATLVLTTSLCLKCYNLRGTGRGVEGGMSGAEYAVGAA